MTDTYTPTEQQLRQLVEHWRKMASQHLRQAMENGGKANALRDELKALREQLDVVHDSLDYFMGLTAAKARDLRRDAERYRWLRDMEVLAWKRDGDRRANFASCHGKRLDECIDAELAKTK